LRAVLGLIASYDRVTARYINKDDDAIVDWAAARVEAICPELAGYRDLACVHRWPVAGYLAAPGFWRQSRALLAGIPQDGRVHLAGDLFGAGSMESAIAAGQRCAQAITTAQARRSYTA
jgi:oxygen-dependent protoporphyrinogen oxidase